MDVDFVNILKGGYTKRELSSTFPFHAFTLVVSIHDMALKVLPSKLCHGDTQCKGENYPFQDVVLVISMVDISKIVDVTDEAGGIVICAHGRQYGFNADEGGCKSILEVMKMSMKVIGRELVVEPQNKQTLVSAASHAWKLRLAATAEWEVERTPSMYEDHEFQSRQFYRLRTSPAHKVRNSFENPVGSSNGEAQDFFEDAPRGSGPDVTASVRPLLPIQCSLVLTPEHILEISCADVFVRENSGPFRRDASKSSPSHLLKVLDGNNTPMFGAGVHFSLLHLLSSQLRPVLNLPSPCQLLNVQRHFQMFRPPINIVAMFHTSFDSFQLRVPHATACMHHSYPRPEN